MPLFVRFRYLLVRLIHKTSGWVALMALLLYLLSSWSLMWLADESALLPLDTFLYWIVVTASTVGYGDYSPATSLGKLLTAFWVIPAGLSLFALVITRLGLLIQHFVFRGRKGLLMLKHDNHTLIIGWNASRTLRLIELLLAKQDHHREALVLCVTDDMENPLSGRIDFVRVDAFTDPDSMARAGIASAARIIIDTPQDDVTLTTALFCTDINPGAHKTAYFQQESLADLLRIHCPKVEVIPSVAVEMLARSSLDPGSSLLHKQLLDSTDGMTQYSQVYEGQETRIEPLFEHFKQQLSATLIGIQPLDCERMILNPDLDQPVQAGDTLFYIAAQRLTASQCFAKEHDRVQ